MLFALLCMDKPNHIDLRMATRPSHLEFLNDLNAKGILKIAGPFLDDSGKPCGTLSIIETATREDAEILAQSDPYAVAGLFETVEVRAYNLVFNTPK